MSPLPNEIGAISWCGMGDPLLSLPAGPDTLDGGWVACCEIWEHTTPSPRLHLYAKSFLVLYWISFCLWSSLTFLVFLPSTALLFPNLGRVISISLLHMGTLSTTLGICPQHFFIVECLNVCLLHKALWGQQCCLNHLCLHPQHLAQCLEHRK